jgi:hypothetical protein
MKQRLARWVLLLAVILTTATSFDLPSIDPYRIAAEGEIAWTAEGRMGIKLAHMPVEAGRKYREWLEVLQGQHEFRRLTEEAKATQALMP